MKSTKQPLVLLLEYAKGFPGAYEDHPWGETAVKVNKKIFVAFGPQKTDSGDATFTVKLPRSAKEALKNSYASSTGYGLGKHGWVTFRVTAQNVPPFARMQSWVEESYRAVAPKKLLARLDGDEIT